MLTTLITGGRQSGKTTQLEKLKKGLTVIVVVNQAMARARNNTSIMPVAVIGNNPNLSKYKTILIDNIDMMGPEALALISRYRRTAEIHASVTPMIIEDKENPPWQYTIRAKTRIQLEPNSKIQECAQSMNIRQAATQLQGVWVICE